MYNFTIKYRSVLTAIAKILIFTGAIFVIVQKLAANDLHFLHSVSVSSLSKPLLILSLPVLISFSSGNWFFEILKWKKLVQSVKPISLYESFKQSTASLTASLLTPNRIGEYGAKALFFRKTEQKKILGLNFIGNSLQLLVTILFGLPALFFLSRYMPFKILRLPQGSIIPGVFILLIGLIFFYFFFRKSNYVKRLRYFIRSIPSKIIWQSLGFSIIRYLFFAHQFYFLLYISGVHPGYVLSMSLIAGTYLIASAIPGFVLLDFVVKGSVAVGLFGMFGIDELTVLSVTTIMWLLNFALPALIGSYFVLRFNLPEPQPVVVKKP